MKKDNLNQNKILKQLTILYIEDEESIRINVKTTLEMLCDSVIDVIDIKSACEILSKKQIDIIISDINLPEKDGITFVKELRQKDKTIPVILLSAYTDKEYLFEATKLKLVDYLVKPINFPELHKSLLKCVEEIIEYSRYIVAFDNDIEYNVRQKLLLNTKTEENIPLTFKELSLLEYLIKNQNRLVNHEEIKTIVWEDCEEATDSALKNLINKLRKKIGKDTISNISGVGFRMNL